MTRRKKKVLVAMSGGVDSSVAAALLLEQGYEVVGCFMRLGSPGESLEEPEQMCQAGDRHHPPRIGHQGCCSINDAKDAQLVAAKLGIGFYVLNFKPDFTRIIDYFVGEYNAGRTPNPCVRCNDWLKFGKLGDYADSIGAQYLATGHYARVELVDGQWSLLQGIDVNKDQSYVLFGTRRENLPRMILPCGRYFKPQIRQLARDLGLNVSEKPDSQEICFVPDNDYGNLIRRRTPERVEPGPVVDGSGKVVGRHEGHQMYTVGQRRGLRIAAGKPMYVVSKDAASNRVTVGPREMLAARYLEAEGVNWLIDPQVGPPRACRAKIRSNAQPVDASVEVVGPDRIKVVFEAPQYSVAPGQAVVCYEGERVIVGGWIESAGSDSTEIPPAA